MREGLRVGRYTKVVLTLIVVFLAALLCKPFFVTMPVTAYTTADDAYYHADEAYHLANEALEKAKETYRYADEAYDYAGRAYYRAEKAHQKAEESYSEAYRAESRADEAHKRANEAYDKARVTDDNAHYYADNAYKRAKRELSNVTEVFEAMDFLIRNNREDLVKMGKKLEITVSSLEDLLREFKEMKEREE